MGVLRAFVALLGIALVAGLSEPPPKVVARGGLNVLPNPLVLKVVGRSQLEFVADLFWVRMANMAGTANTRDEYTALLPIANLIADLAPRFKYPYYVGGVLAPMRRGRTKEYDNAVEAVALMQRGVTAVPSYTRLHVQKAYSELEMLHQPVVAARTLQIAARLPDAPDYVGKLATRMLAQAGEFDDARAFALEMATSADDPQVRADFELRLKQIDLERVLTGVDEAARRYEEEQGHPTTSVDELVAKGYLPEVPSDPFGGVIELTVTGARSSVESSRLRVHVAPE